MTRGQIKTLFRRRVHDEPGLQWSDAEQNDLVNLAYAKVQKEIVKIRRDAHIYWDYINTEVGTNWYPLPQTFGIRRVGLKADNTATGYTKLKPKNYDDVVELTNVINPCYVEMGQWIGIFPAPAVAVANGIQLVHTPIMALSADTEVPRIKTPLHDAIPLWMAIIAKGETDEEAQAAKEELGAILSDLGEWYVANTDEPDQFQIVGV